MTISEFRSLRWIDYLLYALTDPRALFRIIIKNKPMPFALSFSVPIVLVAVEIVAITLCKKSVGAFFIKMSYGWILGAIVLALCILINAALMDFISQMFELKGAIKEKIVLLNFALFPKFFILPFMYIFYVFNFAVPFFYVFFSIVLTIWSLVVVIQGISEMYSVDLGKSMLIVFFPVVLLSVCSILLATLASLFMVGLLFS